MLKRIFEAFFVPIGTAGIIWQIIGNDLPINQAIILTGGCCGVMNLILLWIRELDS